MNPFLVGEKIQLRPMEAGDAALTAMWFNRHEVRRTTRSFLPRSVHAQQERLTQPIGDHDIPLGIVLREDERLVGACGLHKIDHRARHAEIGIVVGERADWGRGIATDAMRLLVGYGFDEVNLNRIWLEVYEDNPAARHIYEKLGFTLEGTLRKHAFREGRYWDLHLMGMLADEWRKR